MRLALLVVLAPAIAQADVDEKGLRAGTVFTGLSHDAGMGGSGGSKPDFGIALGSYVTVRTAPWFAFQFEAQLDLQRFELHQGDNQQIGNVKAWCFEVPVLARFDTIPGDRTKLYFVAGPSLVFFAGGEIKDDADATTNLDGIEPFNLAVAGGIGVQWTAGPGRIAIDARYRRLLFPFSKGPPFFNDLEGEAGQPHMIEVFVGYAFP